MPAVIMRHLRSDDRARGALGDGGLLSSLPLAYFLGAAFVLGLLLHVVIESLASGDGEASPDAAGWRVVMAAIGGAMAATFLLVLIFFVNNPDPSELPLYESPARFGLALFVSLMGACVGKAIGQFRQAHAARGAHRCRGCGYDLTGNTSGICPECGKSV